MARFKAGEEEHYGGQGGTGFFTISNDKEVKRVRFMYNNVDDIEGYAVHRVEIGDGKFRYVNCLRDYNDAKDMCPFCRENMFTQARLIIPVYNIDEDAVQLWDRGKTFFQKMTSLCSRYASGKDTLVSHIFEVERNGKPKDMKTTYEIYEVDQDDTTLNDLPEVPDILGGFVLDKTADDMEYYLEEGEFPPEDNDEEPVRRRSESRSSSRSSSDRTTTRRTPAGRRSNEETF